MLLLQSTPFERGYQVGQALAPCCCLSVFFLFGALALAGVGYAVWRSTQSAAPPPPPAPDVKLPPPYQAWAGGGADLPAMQKKQADLLADLPPNQRPETDAINAAAKKLVAQDFDGAIAAYEEIAARFPHRAGDAHGQIGAAWFFKRDYERALLHYRKAIELGAPREPMEDNIREAEEARRRG